jgi:hypothetical protein
MWIVFGIKKVKVLRRKFGEVGRGRSTYRGSRTRGRAVRQVSGTMDTPLIWLLDGSRDR